MNGKGVQNAQLQGPHPATNPDVAASWWNIYVEGDGLEGISRH